MAGSLPAPPAGTARPASLPDVTKK
jgi:hypothetical protein